MSGPKGLDAKHKIEDVNQAEMLAMFSPGGGGRGASAGGAGGAKASEYKSATRVLGGPRTNSRSKRIRVFEQEIQRNAAAVGPAAFANTNEGRANAAVREKAAANYRATAARAKENRVATARAAAMARRATEEAAQKAQTNAYTHAIQYGTTKKVAKAAGQKAYYFAKTRKSRKSRKPRKTQPTRKNNRR